MGKWMDLYLWLHSPLLDFDRFFSFFILYTVGRTHSRGISQSQGSYLHTEQHKHRINANRYSCLEWVSNPRSQFSSERRQFMPQTARPLWSVKWMYRSTFSWPRHELEVSGEWAPGNEWIEGWVDTRSGLDDKWRRENSWSYRDSNSDPSVVQPVASRYSDFATPALWEYYSIHNNNFFIVLWWLQNTWWFLLYERNLCSVLRSSACLHCVQVSH
jgi:hypothetical protein